MSDKTEQPTPKRLRESREKGDVCKSQDVPSALTVLALSIYIVVMGRQLLESLLAMMELAITTIGKESEKHLLVFQPPARRRHMNILRCRLMQVSKMLKLYQSRPPVA